MNGEQQQKSDDAIYSTVGYKLQHVFKKTKFYKAAYQLKFVICYYENQVSYPCIYL